MNRTPLKLLSAAYGLAGAAALWAFWAGAPVWGSILGFWVGGAALALGLAMVPGVAGVLGVAPAHSAAAAATDDLSLWDEDLAEENAALDPPIEASDPGSPAIPRLRGFG